MRAIITFIIFLSSITMQSQNLELEKVRLLGVKNLKFELGDSTLLDYIHIDNEIGVWYKYGKNDTTFVWVNSVKDISFPHKDFKILSYKFCGYIRFPYPKCPPCDTIFERFHIVFNERLKVIEKSTFNFIPKTYLLNDSCNIISRTELSKIVERQNFKFGTDSLNMNLKFDQNRQMYVWTASKINCESIDEAGRCWGEIEILDVEAETGKVIDHYITSYGHIVDY